MSDEATATATEKQGEFPKKVKLDNLDAIKGLVVVLWRKQAKQAARILGGEKDTDGDRVIYECLTEPDKGLKFSAKYDPSQEVLAYDEETMIQALLEK